MPITVPPFVQYQAQLFPLRGLWNSAPPEGDRFVSAEIDWGVTTGIREAVQFALSGNSPVAFSQIVAFSVDNSRCGADVTFLFPDSGYSLVVPAYNEGVFPVFTNALMFYAYAPAAVTGDVTVFQVLNSMPPPVSIQPSEEQSQAIPGAIDLTVNGTTQLVAAPIAGTIEAMSFTVQFGTAGTAGVTLQDGTTHNLWATQLTGTAGTMLPINLSGLRLRFVNGLKLIVSGSSMTGPAIFNANVYYSVP